MSGGRDGTTQRGVILEIRATTLVVTVMPAHAPPYRARVAVPLGADATEWRIGGPVQLVIGDDPADVHLAGPAHRSPGHDPDPPTAA